MKQANQEKMIPPSEDSPSAVLTLEILRGGDVWTTKEICVGQAPQKPPKSYNVRCKGEITDSSLEEKKKYLLRRILPPTDTSQTYVPSPKGTDDLY